MLMLSISGVQSPFTSHNFKRVSNYSIVASKASSEIPNSMVDYLVNSLGFSKEEAFVTSSKVRFTKSTTFKSTENPNSVIDYLKISGFSQSQIKQLVSKAPQILSSNVDITLNPKIQALHDFGFSKSDLAHVISSCPGICLRSLNDHIIPTLEILKSVFGDNNEVLINAVKNSPWLLGSGTKKGLPDAVSLLKSYGVSDDQIKLFASRKIRFLSSTMSLEPVLIRVENLGIPRGSGMFFLGIYALCSFSEASLDARKRIYKSYGFTDEDVSTLARKAPHALILSESRLRNSLDFFMKEAGYLPSQIANRPNVLTYSLEKRVIPRYRVWNGLKEREIQKVTNKKLKMNAFLSCLKMTEPEFFEKFVQPFKDECPDLYSDYIKVTRPVLKIAK